MNNNPNPFVTEPKFMFDENTNLGIDPTVIDTHDTAEWKSIKGSVLIRDMDNGYLQKAFEDVQYAELKLLKDIEKLNEIKEHILFESARRKIRLLWLDEQKSRHYGGIFRAERAVRKITEYAAQKYTFRENFRKEYAQKQNALYEEQEHNRAQQTS